MDKKNRGFTLIELLVAIAIVGILAVVAVPALFSNIGKAKVANMESDYKAVKAAIIEYYSDKNKYPTGFTSGVFPHTTGKYLYGIEDYIDKIPDKCSIGEKYSLVNDESKNKIALRILNPKINQRQLDKMIEDFGEKKLFTGAYMYNDIGTNEVKVVGDIKGKVNLDIIIIGNTKE